MVFFMQPATLKVYTPCPLVIVSIYSVVRTYESTGIGMPHDGRCVVDWRMFIPV